MVTRVSSFFPKRVNEASRNGGRQREEGSGTSNDKRMKGQGRGKVGTREQQKE
jgi:hypothetical protein